MSWACFSLRFSQLWDLDGTLIDTSSASMITLQQLIVELGGELELSTLVPIVEQSAAISTGQKATKSSKEHWAQQVLRVTGLEAKVRVAKRQGRVQKTLTLTPIVAADPSSACEEMGRSDD